VPTSPASGLPQHAVGLLALTPSGKILYRNAEAHRFCAQLALAEGSSPGRLSPAVGSAIARLSTNGALSGETVTVVVGDHKNALMLRAFLVPGTPRGKPPMIIVLIEPWSEITGESSGLVETDMHLTGREREVLGCLMKGLTNKEIAAALGVSEATVKAHVASIMVKSHTSTRMELVASVLGRRSEPSL
jgi:DNA-binding CsgD family transcriptional regulator